MRNKRKLVFAPLLVCVLLAVLASLVAVPCMAADYDFSYSYEIEKESIGFSDANACSGHVYFDQFSVNQNQWVAVCYRFSETDDKTGGSFSRVYIDIYDAEGDFFKEISFDTSQEIAIELTENAVLVFFHTHVMAYTWEDNGICGYQMADYDSLRGGIFSDLRKAERTVGEWTYRAKKALHGYTKLVRQSGSTEQVLVELPGTKFNVQNTMLPAVLIGAAAIALTVAYSSATKRRKPE